MSDSFSYDAYVKDERFLSEYNAYQRKYATAIRESDKVIIALVQDILQRPEHSGRKTELLDAGCSTGNLLLHMKRLLPQLSLRGGDLAESSLAACRANPTLADVSFQLLDLLNMPADARYDIITVNAVLYMMDDAQFGKALRSIAGALKPGGTVIVFDFFHPYPQDLDITELSKSHPAGLRLRFRRIDNVRSSMADAGFGEQVFRPFTLPIDLPPSGEAGDLITYTVPAADGRRLPFRGALFQPWCHMSGQKT